MIVLLQIIIYSIVVYNISNMVAFTDGPFDIFYGIRKIASMTSDKLYKLVTCMICLPTYVGLTMSVLNMSLLTDINFTPMTILYGQHTHPLFILFFDSIFASGITWLIHTIQTWFEKNTMEYESNDETTLLND